MKVMLLGAAGFIGGQVAARLIAAGHQVCAGVRPGAAIGPGFAERMDCDLARDHAAALWAERLEGFDAVVNAVGILRPSSRGDFEAVHIDGPAALWAGCEQAGIARVIQISALGDPALTEFIGSKHRGDERLMAGGLDWTVLRPSVVHSPRASYGGTTLLRALAAMPGALLLPGAGEQRIQPVSVEDLCDAVIGCLDHHRGHRQVVELVGPEVVSLADYLMAYRRWLGVAGSACIHVPRPLIGLASTLGEWIGRGPLGRTMFKMLEQGNVGNSEALARTEEILGRAPQSLENSLAAVPAGVEPRWQARVVLLLPLLRWCLGLTWVVSGLVGLTIEPEDSAALLAPLSLPDAVGQMLVLSVSLLDLVLGVALLARFLTRWVIGLMLISVLSYTLILGIAAPQLWLEPLGGLLKNLPMIPALALLWVLDSQR